MGALGKEKRHRGRHIHGKAEARIAELALTGEYGPKQIEDLLIEEQELEREAATREGRPFSNWVPHLKTIQKRLRAFGREEDPPWTVAQASPEQAALVLPVLGRMIRSAMYEGEELPTPGISQAEWIARVRQAAPDIPLMGAWRMATLYRSRLLSSQWSGTSGSTVDLDRLLALAPWRDQPDASGEYPADEYTLYPSSGMHAELVALMRAEFRRERGLGDGQAS